MISSARALLGAISALFLLFLLLAPPFAQAAKDQTAKAQRTARKNGCIIALYAGGQKPWPSSRRNRPLRMFTVFKNRGSTPYTTYLRFYKQPEAQFSPPWNTFPNPVPNPPQFRAKPPQPNAVLNPDFFAGDILNYFVYGPITIHPGTNKIAWVFTLPNCAGPQKFNVTVSPLDLATIPQTCWGSAFGVRRLLLDWLSWGRIYLDFMSTTNIAHPIHTHR